MAYRSIRERTARLDRRLLSSERYANAKLEVQYSTGEVAFVLGGRFDRRLRRYVEGDCEARVIRMKKSQDEILRVFAEYLRKRLAGDEDRIALLMAIGDRGGGKTWFCAFMMVVLALALPGTWQIGVSITSKQNREVKDAIAQIADPSWIENDVDDFRDPRTEFLTGSTILWATSKNPKALRQAQLQFELIVINEGQDQQQKIYTNAQAAVRKGGGLVAVATNPPTDETGAGDWVAILYQGLEASNSDGRAVVIESKYNDAVNQTALSKNERLIRLVDPAQADADSLGIIKLSGNIGYQGFQRRALELGDDGLWKSGHIGEQQLDWVDITLELTGFDHVGGCDFQTDPGPCAVIGKLFRTKWAPVVLWCKQLVGVQGTELHLSWGLHTKGYFPGNVDFDGKRAPSLLLIGDGTGARQAASHRRTDPYSYTQLRGEGWSVEPPMYYGPKKTPWNPLVDDSRKQMKACFMNGLIVISSECGEGVNGFPSLLDGLQNTKVTSAGKFVKKGHWTHFPDGLRYLAWKYLPRSQVAAPPAPDRETANRIRGIRLFGRR